MSCKACRHVTGDVRQIFFPAILRIAINPLGRESGNIFQFSGISPFLLERHVAIREVANWSAAESFRYSHPKTWRATSGTERGMPTLGSTLYPAPNPLQSAEKRDKQNSQYAALQHTRLGCSIGFLCWSEVPVTTRLAGALSCIDIFIRNIKHPIYQWFV